MLGAICGDIIGSPYEFGNIKTTDFPLFQEKSHFTDDTVMTVAIAEALMDSDAHPNSVHGKDDLTCACAESMRKFGRLHPDAGYGGKFCRWLENDHPRPYGSWGNGSAMRVSAVAWEYDYITDVLTAAEASAMPTHNSPEGIRGAKAVAAAVFMARKGAHKEQIRRYIQDNFYYDLSRTLDQIRPGYAFDVSCQGSVPEAITAFLESEDWEDCIRKVVSLGGDCDTTGAMAGAIAEAYYGKVPNWIAQRCRALLSDDLLAVLDKWEKRHAEERTRSKYFETLERPFDAYGMKQLPSERYASPYYDRLKERYVAPGIDGCCDYESEDLSDFAETMSHEGLIFHFDEWGVPNVFDLPDHAHDFIGVMRHIMGCPERFFIPDGTEREYSAQEIRFMQAWQRALLAMKGNNAKLPPVASIEEALHEMEKRSCGSEIDDIEPVAYETATDYYLYKTREYEDRRKNKTVIERGCHIISKTHAHDALWLDDSALDFPKEPPHAKKHDISKLLEDEHWRLLDLAAEKKGRVPSKHREREIWAVDFDGTLYGREMYGDEPCWNEWLLDFLYEKQAKGDYIILWTCRTGAALDAAVNLIEEETDLELSAINENLDFIREKWASNGVELPRKIYANHYIDDNNAEDIPLLAGTVKIDWPGLQNREP